jgi:MFS transporter, MFS domain-containing protein family, molybdate-anion transporter
MADWLQGPYFYQVYASKQIAGQPASVAWISRLFLTGFASTAIFGPSVGRLADTYGRRLATLSFCLVYALGALSTKSPLLVVLFAGRVLSGIGTSLLFSAPEAWIVGAMQKIKSEMYLGETFGQAYAGDSIVAIIAGQLAGWAALKQGPTGPFMLSTAVLTLGGILAAWLWDENKAVNTNNQGDSKPSIKEAIQVIQKDPTIGLLGGVQAFFEAAMYIFVLQWPPAMVRAIKAQFGSDAQTPFGQIFSCFMACCWFGATLFGQMGPTHWKIPTETSTLGMLAIATMSMTSAALLTTRSSVGLGALPPPVLLGGLMASLFAFEMCVGLYFPSIGTLRSKYIPDSQRSVVMNLFGIPLNVLVVSVFLSIQKLGVSGALAVSSTALGVATICMWRLQRRVTKMELERQYQR